MYVRRIWRHFPKRLLTFFGGFKTFVKVIKFLNVMIVTVQFLVLQNTLIVIELW